MDGFIHSFVHYLQRGSSNFPPILIMGSTGPLSWIKIRQNLTRSIKRPKCRSEKKKKTENRSNISWKHQREMKTSCCYGDGRLMNISIKIWNLVDHLLIRHSLVCFILQHSVFCWPFRATVSLNPCIVVQSVSGWFGTIRLRLHE